MLLRSSSTPALTSLAKGFGCQEEIIRGLISKNESPIRSRICKTVSFSPSVTSRAHQQSRDFDDDLFVDCGDWDFEGEALPMPSFWRVQSETDLHSLGQGTVWSSAASSLTTSPLVEGKSPGFTDGERWCSNGSRHWSRRVSLRRQSSLSVISSTVSNFGSKTDALSSETVPEAAERIGSENVEEVVTHLSGAVHGHEHRDNAQDNPPAEYLYRVQDNYREPPHRSHFSSLRSHDLGEIAGALETEFGLISKGAHGTAETKVKHSDTSMEKVAWMCGRDVHNLNEVLRYTSVSEGGNPMGMVYTHQERGQLVTQSDIVGTMLMVSSLGTATGGGGGGDRRRPIANAGTGGGGGGQNNSSETETYYRRALAADPGHPLLLRNYAKFLHEVKKDSLRAEGFFERAILGSPGDGELIGQYAELIWDVYKDKERAGNYFERALQAAPDDCYLVAAYASFLWGSEGDDEDSQAEVSHSNVTHVPSLATIYNSSIPAHAASG